jgi:hypothetical protein
MSLERVELVAGMWARTSNRILLGKRLGESLLGRPRRRCEVNGSDQRSFENIYFNINFVEGLRSVTELVAQEKSLSIRTNQGFRRWS